jgi:hypothetical protein
MNFKAVRLQTKAFNNPGSDLSGVMQHPVRLISGMKFLSDRQSTDPAASFKDEDFTTPFGQKGGGGQAVMAGTDNNYIVCVARRCFHTLLDFP